MADSWEDAEPSPPKAGLSADAPSFTFNPTASSWQPRSFAPPVPPAPAAAAAAAAAPAVAAPAPAAAAATPAEPVVAAEETPAAAAEPVAAAAETVVAAEPAAAAAVEPVVTAPSGGGAGGGAGAEDAAAADAAADADAAATPKSKKADEAEELPDDADPREHMNVVFIGHVDAGKSTLSGNILYLSGEVDQRLIEKFQKQAKERNRESWFLAFIMDTNEEERAKGKTVEVGRAHFATENRRFTILDAPGHKNYVPNMIAGAAQADVGVLVISARKGEFETGFEGGGQTREHALLAKTLGVSKLIVAINKMDEPTVKWSEKRFLECKDKLKPFLKSSGFNTKKHVKFVPISALTGANVMEPMDPAVCKWWTGRTLMQELDRIKIGTRDPTASVRIPVLDKYNDRGVIIMGKVESGTITTGMNMKVFPTDNEFTVDTIMVNDDVVSSARVGENVKVKIKGLNEEDFHKGFVLASDDAKLQPCVEFDAQLMLLDLGERGLFTAGYDSMLHCHTIDESVTVVKLLGELNKKTKEMSKRPPRFVRSHSVCTARLRVPQSVAIETYEDMPQLGRFTLRDENATVAIGKVLKIRKMT